MDRSLLYNYTGDSRLVDNMRVMADYWLAHGLSKPTDQWNNLPFPYNTSLHSGAYDGDMRAGKNFLQPDKAGSFGKELVNLYKTTGEESISTRPQRSQTRWRGGLHRATRKIRRGRFV
jgi:hypothetical protein